MRKSSISVAFLTVGVLAGTVAIDPWPWARAQPRAAGLADSAPGQARGETLYDRFCLACHGVYGDGRGPAAPWLWPRPRDFTRGEYKWRSTPSGAPPTAEDLATVIRHGVPGTSMHGFGATLTGDDIQALVGHLASFAPDAFAQPAVPIAFAAPPESVSGPPVSPAVAARGARLYSALGCVACHGPEGKGDGAAAANLRTADGLPAPPYDLTAQPLRRPGRDAAVVAVYKSLQTGLMGTAMPSYQGAAPDEDIWAVAAYIDSIRFRGAMPSERNAPVIAAEAVRIDKESKLVEPGWYPGNGTPDEMAIFARTMTFQGPRPQALTPAQGSLDADQCARCHNKQLREWRGARHSHTGSPGMAAQVERQLRAGERSDRDNGAYAESCQRCHAPLALAQPVVRAGHSGGDDDLMVYQRNPALDRTLRDQGVNCASCHVRDDTRYGPPRSPGSKLLGLPGYPLVEATIYERSDFCLPCHQLAPRAAQNGRPFLDTYREWLEGPYMRRGVQCQHCHMPNREHTWKGVHDPETFREGIRVEAIAGRGATSGVVSVRARLTNIGAGHYLPTTPTPVVWLRVELIDAGGRAIAGARAEKRIGRHLEYRKKIVEIEDTRVPPGESVELSAAWQRGRVAQATHAKVTVQVRPDDYYERLYRLRLQGALDGDIRAMFQEMLDWTLTTPYTAVERLVPID